MLVNRPNNVLANQRYFQAPSQLPLWIRGKRDKLIVSVVFTGLGIGLLGVTVGTGKMVLGNKN
ncbi:hypothetical protein A0J61_03355 [Choanephora cucurbitarum]|uniref:Uncharacterized protein n=1 Tax=Choanephora cucurbitarum TaxID=101091 RepID=A0A1C7NHK4_9FUNG|nr:hypothetical protein A0J61_03355 [Choanephora cucurbitarum]